MHAIAEPLAALWTRTRAMLARALAAIGAPEAIASVRVLAEDRRRLISQWLGLLEHIVRKLLLAEASRLRPTFAQAEGRPTAGLQARIGAAVADRRAPARSKLDIARPETWRARFSFAIPRDLLAVPESCAPRIRALWGDAPPQTAVVVSASRARQNDERHTPLRLAQRLEALRRVVADPGAHAQSLARALLRLRRRFPEVIRRFAVAAARVCFFDPEDARLSIHAGAAALDAAESFADSS